MPMRSHKSLATKLARACRRFLKVYASYRSTTDPKDVGGASQFLIMGMSKREKNVIAKAYVTVYPTLDVNVEYDQWFPEELFDCLKQHVTPSFVRRISA